MLPIRDGLVKHILMNDQQDGSDMRSATCQTISSSKKCELSRNDPRTGFAFQCTTDILGIGDESLLASGFEEANDGLDFGSH